MFRPKRVLPAFVALGILNCLVCSNRAAAPKTCDPAFSLSASLIIGEYEQRPAAKAYRSIQAYYVDNIGNIYISDLSEFLVDKYDPNGRYVRSFGHKGQGPGEFSSRIENFVVDADGNLIAYNWPKNSLTTFSSEGNLLRESPLPDAYRQNYIRTIKISPQGDLVFMTWSKDNGYGLCKFDASHGVSTQFYSDKKRARPTFGDILPDFDFGDNGDIFVTDSFEYRIYRYSKNLEPIGSIEKQMGKHKIIEEDFTFLFENQVIKIPGYENYWKSLSGGSRFLPNIFGINVDNDRIYVWTSDQDKQKRYIVDVYDREFRQLCSFSWYNFLPKNYVVIKNRVLYTPNIGSNDKELLRLIGRFGLFVLPYRIEVYRQLSEKAQTQ